MMRKASVSHGETIKQKVSGLKYWRQKRQKPSGIQPFFIIQTPYKDIGAGSQFLIFRRNTLYNFWAELFCPDMREKHLIF